MDWQELYCHLSASLGWTRSQIDDMTLPELRAFTKYWRSHPPVHLLVAAYLGYVQERTEADNDLGQLMLDAATINGNQ